MQCKGHEPRRILFFIPSLVGGGAQHVTVNVLRKLDRVQYRPYLVLVKREGPYLTQLPHDVPVFELKSSRTSRKVHHIRQLVDIIARTKPELVVSSLNAANVLALVAKQLSSHRFKLIVTVQNNLIAKFGNRPILKRWLKMMFIRYIYPSADHIIAVSQGVKYNLVQDFGLPPSRISTIYNSIDIEKVQMMAQSISTNLHSDGSQKIIIAVGSLDVQKGFYDLIKAFALVRDQVPASLIILGEGPLRGKLEATIQELCLTDHVCMPGFVANPYSYLAQAELFVLSSYWEGLPVALIEAMACGVPVIATNCDYGPGEIITHGENGNLVPAGDIDKMSQAMINLLSDKSEASRLRVGGLHRAADFDSVKICRRYEGLFEMVLDE